ncbi:aldo/keto reductase family protein [Burkholderia cenocepacia]|uniref:Aldo/keto reductase family protein n=1 Tax=Burkholderia cenocepacia TaxID=95486 RepID=A0AAN0RNY9_9BURK|nr:aldo/keto reductase family protein [Burkholderia cenocepacia]
MKHASLGSTGMYVSSVGLGTATLGVAPRVEDADRLVGRALDLGITLVDTANSYGNQPRFDRPGAPPAAERESAEEILGRALGARRHDLVLCSKVMEPIGDGPNDRGLSRRHIFSQVESSLRRLRTDYLDVYYAHHPDPHTPIEQTLSAFNDLIRQGKIRYYALSTFGAWQMTETLWKADRLGLAAPVCNQVAYSLANRTAEEEIVPACLKFGLTLTAFAPLGGGLLAGEQALQRPIVGAQRFGLGGFNATKLDLARRFNALAHNWGYAPSSLALAWLLSRPSVSCAIVGAESIGELETATNACDIELPPDLLTQLDEIGRPEPRAWY